MDSASLYKHKEGFLEIPTESMLGKKKKTAQYYFKLDRGVLSWYSKASDKKPKGSLSLNTATEIKRQGGLSVVINYKKGDDVDTFLLNCQNPRESEDWCDYLMQNMIVCHAGISPGKDQEQPQQPQQLSQSKKLHLRHSFFARNKGSSTTTDPTESVPVVVNSSYSSTSSSKKGSQQQAVRPSTVAFESNERSGFATPTRPLAKVANVLGMSAHRKTQEIGNNEDNNVPDEPNEDSWVKVASNSIESNTLISVDDDDDGFVIINDSGNIGDSSSAKTQESDDVIHDAELKVSVGKPTLCLDDDDDDDDDVGNDTVVLIDNVAPDSDVKDSGSKEISFDFPSYTKIISFNVDIDDDDDDLFLMDKKSDTKVTVKVDVSDESQDEEQKCEEADQKAETVPTPVVEEVLPENVEDNEEKEETEIDKEQEVHDIKQEENKIEAVSEEKVIEETSTKKEEIKEEKEEKEEKQEEKQVKESQVIVEHVTEHVEEDTKENEKKDDVVKEPENGEKIKIKEEIIEDSHSSLVEEASSKNDVTDTVDVDEKVENVDEMKSPDEKEEEESKIEEEVEIQPSEEALKNLSEEFAKDCDFDFSDTLTFENGYKNNDVNELQNEDDEKVIRRSLKYDSNGYVILKEASDFNELIALSFPPDFIGVNAGGILVDRSPDGIWSLNSQGKIVYGSCGNDVILQKKYLLYDAIQKKDKDLETLFRDELRLLEKNLQGDDEHIFSFSNELKICYRSGEWMILNAYKPPVNFSDDDLKESSGDDKLKISFNLFTSKKDSHQQFQDTQDQQQQQQQTSSSSSLSSSSAWSFMSSLKLGKKASEDIPPERPPKPESLTKRGDDVKVTASPLPEQASTPVISKESARQKQPNAPTETASAKEEKKKGGWGFLSKTFTDMKETISNTLPKSMDDLLSSEEPTSSTLPKGGDKASEQKRTEVADKVGDVKEPEEFKVLRSNVELAEREFFKRIREPGNDRINKNIGIIIRAKVCFSIIDIIGKHFKSERRFTLSFYHIWDWVESYSNIISSSDSFDSIKESISLLNASPFKADKNRKLRTFFCHALNNKSLTKWIMLLASDQTRINKFFKDESILKDGDKLTNFLSIIKVLDSLNFVLSDDYEDQLK